jgi:hypothetical protein
MVLGKGLEPAKPALLATPGILPPSLCTSVRAALLLWEDFM